MVSVYIEVDALEDMCFKGRSYTVFSLLGHSTYTYKNRLDNLVRTHSNQPISHRRTYRQLDQPGQNNSVVNRHLKLDWGCLSVRSRATMYCSYQYV